MSSVTVACAMLAVAIVLIMVAVVLQEFGRHEAVADVLVAVALVLLVGSIFFVSDTEAGSAPIVRMD